MVEEICRQSGTLRISTGEYIDSIPVYDAVNISYFTMTETFRNTDGIQHTACGLKLAVRFLFSPKIPAIVIFFRKKTHFFKKNT